MRITKRKHRAGYVQACTQGFRQKLPFSSVLNSMANKLPPNEKIVAKPKKRGHSPHLLTDDQVRQLRAEYFEAKKMRKGSELCRQWAARFNSHPKYMAAVAAGLLRFDVKE